MEDETKLSQFLSQYKLPIAMGLIGAVLLISGIVSSGVVQKTLIKSNTAPTKEKSGIPSLVMVDVSGAVIRPGVYKLGSDARIEEAILAAGGVDGSADPVYLSKSVNLAQKVTDGMKIYIPPTGEAGNSATPAVYGVATQEGVVNINQASLAELDTLPGVGAVTAQKIIDNRPYGSIEDLVAKKVVTKAVFEKIKEKVVY